MEQMTFQSFRKRLQEKDTLSDAVEAGKTLIGAVAFLTGGPVAGEAVKAAGGFKQLIQTLSDGEKMIDTGKLVLKTILDRKPEDYSGRVRQMEDAYGTIYFTSFFDQVSSSLTPAAAKKILLSQREKEWIFTQSPDTVIKFPEFVYGIDAVDKPLHTMYTGMRDRLRSFVRGTSFADLANSTDPQAELELRAFEEACEKLPEDAVRRFHDYFLNLCASFNEFYIYVRLEQEKAKEIRLEERYQTILAVASRHEDTVKAGFADLRQLILDMPKIVKSEEMHRLADNLTSTYQDMLTETVAEKKGSDLLNYPQIGEAFIPHAYQFLRYTGKERLSLPDTWRKIEEQQDMTAFLARYMLEPGSVENLLLVLGEPGGGKSLLTKILCGRMSGPSSVFLRIPLREYSMERNIERIVLNQLEQDGKAMDRVDFFNKFLNEFPHTPVTLVFDGYDEVLQATGGIHHALLEDIHDFQTRCREQYHRPVRVIVTSRDVLIDKAMIPSGTSVMRLLEFDEPRQQQWTEIWNEKNRYELAQHGMKEFTPPSKHTALGKLAGQPLLLLMLAIFDADLDNGRNALDTEAGEQLDRTKLYDALLRRFILRELRKGPRGEESRLEEEERPDDRVEAEMRRLGTAALGMLVRGKLSLTAEELNRDLDDMRVSDIPYAGKTAPKLAKAETIFGSFFFIHDSHAAKADEQEKKAAYEFLHKTFYEFLLADLTLKTLIDAVDYLDYQKASGGRTDEEKKENYRRTLDNYATGPFSEAYYAVLSGACLCAEPEVVRMTAEWTAGRLKRQMDDKKIDLTASMPPIVSDLLQHHGDLVRRGRFSLSAAKMSGLNGGKDDPQSSAVYLLNLVILQILTSGSCRVRFDVWAWLSQYLKLNIPLPCEEAEGREKESESPLEAVSEEVLDWRTQRRSEVMGPYATIVLQFMAIFRIHRDENDVVLEQRKKFKKVNEISLLEAEEAVSRFLQDDVTQCMYALHDRGRPVRSKRDGRMWLEEKGLDISLETCISWLHEFLLRPEEITVRDSRSEIADILGRSGRVFADVPQDPSLVLEWLTLVNLLAEKIELPDKYLYHPLLSILKRYARNREIMTLFFKLYRKGCFKDSDIIVRYKNGPYIRTEQLSIVYTSTPRNLNFVKQGHQDIRLLNNLIQQNSVEALADLLEAELYAGTLSPHEHIWQEITMCWQDWTVTVPEKMPRLLWVFLQAGYYPEVEEFLRHKLSYLLEMLIGFRDAMEMLLSVANSVLDSETISNIFIEGEFNSTYDKHEIEMSSASETAVMFVLRMVMSNSYDSVYGQYAYRTFLRHYDKMFGYRPEDAVDILCFFAVTDKFDYTIEQPDRTNDAIDYSVAGFRFVLQKSVQTAAHLLMLWLNPGFTTRRFTRELMNTLRMRGPAEYGAYCVRLCLNRAMADCDVGAVGALLELMDSLRTVEQMLLREYFREIQPYLRRYSPELADKAERFYQ